MTPSSSVALTPASLRLTACLLHTVPGAVGAMTTPSGDVFVVAHHRIDASLTPCQLRAAMAESPSAGVPHVASVIASLECTGGLVDLGGGLYQRTHPAAGDERWFVTTLSAEAVLGIAAGCPADVGHDDVSVRIAPDVDLAVSAVCVSSAELLGVALDRVAFWLHGQCLVDELVASVQG